MKRFDDLVYDLIGPDHWGLGDGFRAPVSETLTVEHVSYPANVSIIRDGEKVIALHQNGMLHDALVLFETGRNDVLALLDIVPEEYELQDTGSLDRIYPPCAVFLQRMPGAFYTSAAMRMEAQLVRRQAQSGYKLNDDPDITPEDQADNDFWHVLYGFDAVFDPDRIGYKYQLVEPKADDGTIDPDFVAVEPE